MNKPNLVSHDICSSLMNKFARLLMGQVNQTRI